MNTTSLRLHRTISSPAPHMEQPLMRLPSLNVILNQDLTYKLQVKSSIKSCPEDQQDQKIQSLNDNLDDLFSRINQLAEEVITQQKSKDPIVEIKPQSQKLKPVYVDKRARKMSFEVVEIPKIAQDAHIVGAHIRQFQLGNTLGQGKFGEVIQCIHRDTGMIFACKKIFKSTIQEYGMEEQLLTELSILQRLNHPNIVKLYNCFTDAYHVFMMTEYIHGQSLERMFGSEESLVSSIIFQVIKALEYLHVKGIAHRDVKPENLLIESGVVKLVDFGWAASFVPNKPDTFCGTLDYVSPEVVQKKKYDGSVDIWSLGILTFQLLSGVVPFKDSLKHVHLANIAGCNKYKLIFPPVIGSEAQDFIRRLLKKQPLLRMSLAEASRHPFITKHPQGNLIQKDIALFMKGA